jgi:hypothetical protein
VVILIGLVGLVIIVFVFVIVLAIGEQNITVLI